MPYKKGKRETEEVISRVKDFGTFFLKAWSQLAMNEFAWFAYRSALIRPSEKRLNQHKMWWLILLNVAEGL